MSSRTDLIATTDRGFYCAAGDFYIDPWKPVDRAVITHAHGDHARAGSRLYIASREGERVLRARMGEDSSIEALDWGQPIERNDVRVSLHPAGHILGSAQVRVERAGEVWVVSGDYKTEVDPTCSPFAPLRAHVFVTESTFGLPIYRWRPQAEIFQEMLQWWRSHRELGRVAVLFAYSLGKAQRVLAGVATAAGGAENLPGEIFTHGAVERMNGAVRASGVALPPTVPVGAVTDPARFRGGLVIAPPSAAGSPWLRRFNPRSIAFASGWMRIRGARRRRALDRGFALSDHVDWPALLATVEATGAERILVTHGYREPVVKYLRERGLDAEMVASAWEGESAAEETATATASAAGEITAAEAGIGEAS